MDLKNTYKQMTNVDIEEQKQLWNERGKGYYGEFLVFERLYSLIKGNCKILMNLNVPVDNKKTTEIDLLMIHETGIYVFEVKHYKGTIYGDEEGNVWTQYFRTTKNSVFKNPILQNYYHVDAVKKLFPDVPVKSVIVFTNEDCDLRINLNSSDVLVTTLSNLYIDLQRYTGSMLWKYNLQNIDSMFELVYKYSSLSEYVLIDGDSKPFKNWVDPCINMLLEKKNELESERVQTVVERNRLKLFKIITSMCGVGVAIICIICSFLIVNNVKEDYEEKLYRAQESYNSELEKFKQNFLHVDEINNSYIKQVNDYVDVSNISIIDLKDNSVSFKATLTINNDVYGISLNENSKYIVMDNNGKVYEYNVFGKHLKYNRYANLFGKGIRTTGNLATIQFYDINKSSIDYIKLTNISLFKNDVNRMAIKDGLELELYEK